MVHTKSEMIVLDRNAPIVAKGVLHSISSEV